MTSIRAWGVDPTRRVSPSEDVRRVTVSPEAAMKPSLPMRVALSDSVVMALRSLD